MKPRKIVQLSNQFVKVALFCTKEQRLHLVLIPIASDIRTLNQKLKTYFNYMLELLRREGKEFRSLSLSLYKSTKKGNK